MFHNNNITRGKASLGRGSRPCPRSRPELRRGRGATGLTWQPTCPSSRDRDGDRDREEEAVATPSSPRTLKQPAGPRRLLNSMETSKGPQRAATTVPVACTCGCGHGWLAMACSTSPYQPWRSRFLGTIPSLFSLWKQAYCAGQQPSWQHDLFYLSPGQPKRHLQPCYIKFVLLLLLEPT